MNSLPSSIETYFKEAGFSGTEIVIIRKLIEGDACTLRDLAFKTGKSTGVLDQAMKKLLKKKIVEREMINGSPKYVLHSLDSVSKWLQEDMKHKKNVLELRHQNFESFIASVVAGKKRPEMQYFQGAEGMKKAYTLLLEKGNDFVQYGPTLFTESEDPLREFNVQYFRERRKRNIFLRVITHNTPLGRRFQNRDPFEYRKTVLVNEHSYPFSFEKIIVGNTVACFQSEAQEACFIEYVELAERERQFFERLWNMKLQHPDEQPVTTEVNPLPMMPVAEPVVPASTKVLSTVREFFLSPKSLVAFAVCALLSAATTYFLYQHNMSLNLQRIQERVKSIAATGVLQISPKDLEINKSEYSKDPNYQKLQKNLERIIVQNPDVEFVYILKPTLEASKLEFVIDVSATDVSSKNLVSKSDVAEPGEIYSDNIDEGALAIALAGRSGVDQHPYTDKWGTFISGAAPIINTSGEISAILGVDVDAKEVSILAEQSFRSLYFFFTVFIFLIFGRFYSLNKSLFRGIVNKFAQI